MTARTCAAVAVVGALLAGCGYKGPLTLPEDTGPVIIRPAPQAQPGAPATLPEPAESTPQSTTPQSKKPPAPATEGTPPGG
jgi:predicted small lipoprotein YifL